MTTQEVLALHTNRAVDLILGAVPEYQHPDENECGHCGYIESRCICNELCFFRTYPGAPPCLEPKDEPSDEFCSECTREAARMDAMDGQR